ncbi:hypothetical protein NP493_579g01030 [Ridgeia piscesae]|uniref:Apple domain-containing protein n=1 Tax=Ridgeia piscesae TaxID=27915 RepID=A0AAD9KUX7_RIDPI|nr:hypothetical protein NP493_579g01030 [Ridgeia piscesae]
MRSIGFGCMFLSMLLLSGPRLGKSQLQQYPPGGAKVQTFHYPSGYGGDHDGRYESDIPEQQRNEYGQSPSAYPRQPNTYGPSRTNPSDRFAERPQSIQKSGYDLPHGYHSYQPYQPQLGYPSYADNHGYGDRHSGYGEHHSGYHGDSGNHGYDEHHVNHYDTHTRVERVVEKVPVRVPVYVNVHAKPHRQHRQHHQHHQHHNNHNHARPKHHKKHGMSLTQYHGFYVEGGSQVYGHFDSLYACMAACDNSPTCFAGDYNPWLKKCYVHSNTTACDTLQTNKKITHFKKVPCDTPETTNGRITLGAQLYGGVETKVYGLQDCISRCASMGGGIAPNNAALVSGYQQICAAIDYDFSRRKCYIHTNPLSFCPANTSPPPTPLNLVANPSVVNIILSTGWEKTLREQGEVLETEQHVRDSSGIILMSSKNMLT